MRWLHVMTCGFTEDQGAFDIPKATMINLDRIESVRDQPTEIEADGKRITASRAVITLHSGEKRIVCKMTFEEVLAKIREAEQAVFDEIIRHAEAKGRLG